MDNGEPSFTRVPRPSNPPGVSAAPGTYASPISNPGMHRDDLPPGDWQYRRQRMAMGIGASWLSIIGCGVGVWLFLRWRAERNKPINRLRRRAQQTWRRAETLRERMPEVRREDAARPAAGLGTALVPLLILLWRASQRPSRSTRTVSRAAHNLSERDWQKRLGQLKERWSPSRLELEKIQISRHH